MNLLIICLLFGFFSITGRYSNKTIVSTVMYSNYRIKSILIADGSDLGTFRDKGERVESSLFGDVIVLAIFVGPFIQDILDLPFRNLVLIRKGVDSFLAKTILFSK